MIGYITLGTNNLERAKSFYDALFADLGIGRMMDFGRGVAWGKSMDQPGFGVTQPFDGKPATVGNGVMIALAMKDRAMVERVYQKALSLGGTCEGKPGDRGGGFYAAYFRDLDGNKLNAFCMGE
jgi:predicted lactoylglutathione lyase